MTGFAPAVKHERKLRLALCGPTGSGKTYSALAIGKAIAGEGAVALIDTEHKSSSLYADEFAFDKLDLASFDPRRYIEAIEAAAKGGYAVLIIDSLSHAWSGIDGALEMVDNAARRQKGNSYVAWRDVTPLHNQLVEAIVRAPMHVIVTMRSKMAYILEEQTRDGRTTQVPKKVGMEPIQRAGVEYEFDVVGDMDLNNTLVISKSRLKVLAGQVVNKPGRKVGEQIVEALSGEAPPPEPDPEPAPSNGVRPDDLATTAQNGKMFATFGELDEGRQHSMYQWMREHYPHTIVEGDGKPHFGRLTKVEAVKVIDAMDTAMKRVAGASR